MAAKTPVTAIATAGFVDPIRGIYTGVTTAGQDLVTDGSRLQTRMNFTTELYYFADVDDDDTWASGIAGIQACFWQTDEGQTTADAASASLDATTGSIRFKTATAGNSKGWLLLLIDPIASRRPGYSSR